MVIHGVYQGSCDVVRYVTHSLPSPHDGVKLDSSQVKDGEIARGVCQLKHDIGSRFANVELDEGARVQVVDGQTLSSLAQDGF